MHMLRFSTDMTDGKGDHKTGVMNDPLGQTHNLASSEHFLHLNLFSYPRF